MKKITTVISFFFCCLSTSVAQKNSPNHFVQAGMRLHLNAVVIEDYKRVNSTSSIIYPSNLDYFSFGFSQFWYKRGHYTELGLADWQFQRGTSRTGNSKEFFIHGALRFEQGKRIGKATAKCQFYMAYGVLPYFQRFRKIPINSGRSPRYGFAGGLKIEVIPKLTFRFLNNWFLDFSTPMTFVDCWRVVRRVERANLTIKEQRDGEYRYALLPLDGMLRLSIGKAF